MTLVFSKLNSAIYCANTIYRYVAAANAAINLQMQCMRTFVALKLRQYSMIRLSIAYWNYSISQKQGEGNKSYCHKPRPRYNHMATAQAVIKLMVSSFGSCCGRNGSQPHLKQLVTANEACHAIAYRWSSPPPLLELTKHPHCRVVRRVARRVGQLNWRSYEFLPRDIWPHYYQ